jgi:hypothetical protein
MTTSEGRWSRAILMAGALVAATSGAARAADNLPPALAGVGGGAPRGIPHGAGLWRVSLGGRTALLRGAGYDPFSTDDAFGQVSLSVTRALQAGPGFASAVGLIWEDGSRGAQARGLDARLSMQRLALALEERFAPRPWIYAMMRLAPAWLRGNASLADPSVPAPLRTSFSTFGLDASAGAALRVTPPGTAFGLWLMGDAGYGWAPAQHLALAPDLPAADRDKAGVTTLSDLAPSGVFFRFAAALSY